MQNSPGVGVSVGEQMRAEKNFRRKENFSAESGLRAGSNALFALLREADSGG
jgi:hypothetical protein